MDPAGLRHRPAAPGDRDALATVPCTSADPRVEPWIHGNALDRHLGATVEDDFRLLVFHEDAGALVAIVAHERNYVVAGADGEPLPGSYLMLVAISDRFRGSSAPDGRRLIDAVLDATFDDIRSRERGPWVSMMVQPGNDDGADLVARLSATRVGVSGGDDVYVLAIE